MRAVLRGGNERKFSCAPATVTATQSHPTAPYVIVSCGTDESESSWLLDVRSGRKVAVSGPAQFHFHWGKDPFSPGGRYALFADAAEKLDLVRTEDLETYVRKGGLDGALRLEPQSGKFSCGGVLEFNRWIGDDLGLRLAYGACGTTFYIDYCFASKRWHDVGGYDGPRRPPGPPPGTPCVYAAPVEPPPDGAQIVELADGRKLDTDYADGLVVREETRSADGRKLLVANYKLGKLHGPYAEWHNDGTPRVRGKYVADRRDGRWTFWYKDGTKKAVGGYALAHDIVANSDDSDVLATGRAGRWQYWRPDGSKRWRGVYRDGRRHGPWTFWHDNGELRASGRFTDGVVDPNDLDEDNIPTDGRSGRWTFWYEDGKKLMNGPYVAGKRMGTWRFWYETGKLEAQGGFREDGTDEDTSDTEDDEIFDDLPRAGRHGAWSFFTEAGNKRAQGAYELGLEVGRWRNWHDDGKPASAGSYIRGEADGPWTFWHDNGTKAAEGALATGAMVGPWKLWHDNGQIEMSGDYLAGRRQGPFTRWFANGNKAMEGGYEGGAIDDPWDPPPRIESSGRVGVWTYWHDNGNKARMSKLVDGKAVQLKCWNQNGRLQDTLTTESGELSCPLD